MKQLLKESYIAMIKNSIWTKMFKNNFFDLNGKKIDILKNWSSSCAYFVSNLLKIFDLIENIHATVDWTVKDILKYWRKEYEWKEVPIWALLLRENVNNHSHIWFYIWNKIAISNSSKYKTIKKHSWDYNKKRKIEKIYVNSKIYEDTKV